MQSKWPNHVVLGVSLQFLHFVLPCFLSRKCSLIIAHENHVQNVYSQWGPNLFEIASEVFIFTWPLPWGLIMWSWVWLGILSLAEIEDFPWLKLLWQYTYSLHYAHFGSLENPALCETHNWKELWIQKRKFINCLALLSKTMYEVLNHPSKLSSQVVATVFTLQIWYINTSTIS